MFLSEIACIAIPVDQNIILFLFLILNLPVFL